MNKNTGFKISILGPDEYPIFSLILCQPDIKPFF